MKNTRFRVIIGPSSFASEDKAPLATLENAGVEVLPNPVGRRWTENEAMQFIQGVDGLLAGLEPLNRKVLVSAGRRLKAVARVGIGMSNVDLDAAQELGIRVSNTPDGPTEAVAEMTLASLLAMTRDLDSLNRSVHEGKWQKLVTRSLSELKVLIVGFGRIGRRVAEVLAPFGCRIQVVDPFLPESVACAFQRVSLLEGLARADAVLLHASGDKPLLRADEFALMRRGCMLLNPSRGELVDEAALIRALESGQVGKAWFDAFWREPYDGELRRFPQVLLTPHACTYTRRCRLRMESEAVSNLLRDLGL